MLFQFPWTGTDPGRLGREGTGYILTHTFTTCFFKLRDDRALTV